MSIRAVPRGTLALVLIAIVVLALGWVETALAATHTVRIANFAFSPATLTITAGDTVTWTNDDSAVHTATSTTGGFDSGDLAQGASYSFTFTEPGTYDYLCTPHPTMTGQIVVQAAAPAATAAPTPAGGPLPDVAMPLDGPSQAVMLAGLLLVGAAGLLVVARRPRVQRRG